MGISTHVLDTAAGRPAAGVPVTLEVLTEADEWTMLADVATDPDGRASDLVTDSALVEGRYRLGFELADYFSGDGIDAFFPTVRLSFVVRDRAEHYHVPLLVSPFGYTTYRGS